MTSIAVIGGGAAGIGAARALVAQGMEVVLFEAAPRLGGNCFGVDVEGDDGRRWTIDAGVSDFNRTTFPECSQLIDELGLPTQPIGTDTSFATVAGRTVAGCRSGRWNVEDASVDIGAFAAEIEQFRTRATEVLDDERFADCTVGRYLDHLGASRAFRELYLRPRAIGCFPMPNCAPDDMTVRGLVDFWRMHGVVGTSPANRHCVTGGMHRYPAAFASWLLNHGGDLQCGSRVLGIVRDRWQVEVRCVDRDDRHRRFRFRHVLFAGHAHDVLPLLEDAVPEERAALAGFGYQRARLVVHRDARLVGHDRDAWGAFHYVVPSGDLPRVRPTITFFPNRLASLPEGAPEVFVTMNPHLEPRPDRVIVERFFVHPVASSSHTHAARTLEAMQGRRRTWYAGSYLRSPFVHENALQSGMHAAQCLMQWEQREVPARQRTRSTGRLRRGDGAAVSRHSPATRVNSLSA